MTTESQSPPFDGTGRIEHVISSVDGPVGLVTLNRPKQLNALARPLMVDLVEALEQHQANSAICAMVVTGGPDVFTAGADITEMADASPVDMLVSDNPAPLWDRIRRLSKPLIAAVAGYALGGGCELAMLCDIIVAADTARFGQPEINLGLMPGGGGTQRLTRLIGKSLAMDMILSGRLELERDLFFLLFSTHDAHEGMHAFVDRSTQTTITWMSCSRMSSER